MATATTPSFIPLGEYLGSTYRPDVDYVDGILEERNVGEFDHSDVQGWITTLLRNREEEWGLRVLPEVRLQVGPTRFRIPDLCVLSITTPRERVIRSSVPLLCVEVLSPRDSVASMRRRAADYFAMGVQTVWILNPETRTGYQCGPEFIEERSGGDLTVPGTPITIDIPNIFRVLDR